jgi:hypothetical protein
MKFELFNDIVTKWKNANEFQDKVMKVKVSPEFFDVFYELIEKLMDTVFYDCYTRNGIDYVLYEWLYGNKSPVTITEDNGDVVKVELNTIKDVYDVMEKYFQITKNATDETTHIYPTYTTDPSDELEQDFAESINEFFGSEIFGKK